MHIARALLLIIGASLTVEAEACPVAIVNTPSEAAQSLAIDKLSQFLACSANDPLNDQSPCNTFASRGLEALYNVTDFKTGPNSHMSASQIYDTVSNNGSAWTKIGSVLDDDNTLCAQSAANAGLPVIAVMKGSPHGHIALVIPGEPSKVSSWDQKLAPMSASFLIGHPDQSYVKGLLNKAYGSVNASKAVYFYRIGN